MYYIVFDESIKSLLKRNNLDYTFDVKLCEELGKYYDLSRANNVAELIDCYEDTECVLKCLEAAGAVIYAKDELLGIMYAEIREDEDEEEDDMSIDYNELRWESRRW